MTRIPSGTNRFVGVTMTHSGMSIMFTMVDPQQVFSEYDIDDHASDSPAVRFAESARIRFMEHMGIATGGEARKAALLSGRGIGLILKSVTVEYKVRKII